MSAETFTTAMFLITAVIAAGVLINAVFPVVYQMAGTFSSATHESDTRLRTDMKIVAEFANTDGIAQIWIKNVGSARIAETDLTRSDVFFGPAGNFFRLDNTITDSPIANNHWYGNLIDSNNNQFWDPGETYEININYKAPHPSFASGDVAYFQFVLPDGIWRSIEFTVNQAS